MLDKQQKVTNRGFTLIELLVVIAIIVILASILFPVFAQARANARRTTCVSNMRQLGIASMMYVQDYDERFYPNRWDLGPGLSRNEGWWYVLIDPYLKTSLKNANDRTKSVSILTCPDIDNSYRDKGLGTSQGVRPTNSYGPNYYLTQTQVFTSPVMVPKALSDIGTPASLVLLAEQTGQYTTIQGRDDTAYASDSVERQGFRNSRTRHLGGSVYTFADGHAKWFKAPSPYTGESLSGVCWQSPKKGAKYANCYGWFNGIGD
jgi:prepilin-type N-terminal cleavage/methylation domain-containing protein/prepilin-type processing-associated H-X9-DG protein